MSENFENYSPEGYSKQETDHRITGFKDLEEANNYIKEEEHNCVEAINRIIKDFPEEKRTEAKELEKYLRQEIEAGEKATEIINSLPEKWKTGCFEDGHINMLTALIVLLRQEKDEAEAIKKAEEFPQAYWKEKVLSPIIKNKKQENKDSQMPDYYG